MINEHSNYAACFRSDVYQVSVSDWRGWGSWRAFSKLTLGKSFHSSHIFLDHDDYDAAAAGHIRPNKNSLVVGKSVEPTTAAAATTTTSSAKATPAIIGIESDLLAC